MPDDILSRLLGNAKKEKLDTPPDIDAVQFMEDKKKDHDVPPFPMLQRTVLREDLLLPIMAAILYTGSYASKPHWTK